MRRSGAMGKTPGADPGAVEPEPDAAIEGEVKDFVVYPMVGLAVLYRF